MMFWGNKEPDEMDFEARSDAIANEMTSKKVKSRKARAAIEREGKLRKSLTGSLVAEDGSVVVSKVNPTSVDDATEEVLRAYGLTKSEISEAMDTSSSGGGWMVSALSQLGIIIVGLYAIFYFLNLDFNLSSDDLSKAAYRGDVISIDFRSRTINRKAMKFRVKTTEGFYVWMMPKKYDVKWGNVEHQVKLKRQVRGKTVTGRHCKQVEYHRILECEMYIDGINIGDAWFEKGDATKRIRN